MAVPMSHVADAHPVPNMVAEVVDVLAFALALKPDVAAGLTASSGLFGALPELDSMAVATVLTAPEDRFHIIIDDDEVTGDLFETVGSLAAFVAGKRAGH